MKRVDQKKRPAEGCASGKPHAACPEALSPQEQPEGDASCFFNQSLDLLCIAGLDGYLKRLNPAWTTRLGWSLKELLAKPFLEFVHPDDREATTAEVGKLAAGSPTILFENRYRHRDGSYIWLQWTARPTPGGKRIFATARDVTRGKRLEQEVLDIADREKERLGRELHDGLCQNLAGIAALSATLSRRLERSSEPEGAAGAAEITKLLNETIGQARDLARGLGPVGLNEAGLDAALGTMAVNIQQMYRVACELECDRPFRRIDRGVEAHLFRIAQEAVNNAITHGRPKRIAISLGCSGRIGLLSIRDNGVGLPEEGDRQNGIGLHTMAYRARLIGGTLDIQPRTKSGTAVTCTFPLSDASKASEGVGK